MSIIPPGVQPGDFWCVYNGNSEVSKWIVLGEWFNGDRFARTRGRQFAHSGVVAAVDGATVTVIQAEPHGVERVAFPFGAGCVAVWSTGIAAMAPKDRPAVVAKAESLVGDPYGWLQYPTIGLHRIGVPTALLRWYIDKSRGYICSQVTDVSERAGGLAIRPDLWPGFVTPQQIADVLMAAGAAPRAGV